ncbi:CP17A-like protein [Mya arenaria]|uniref:CP17A-like protein n=1 Tax=Mya arenaria TaxID=6604 RepID=A0ABY7FIT8_MYAAR|nr:CP17A-like protein [Mya arenaria]
MPRRKGYIPEPGALLNLLMEANHCDDKLLKLESLTDFYSKYGLFRYENKVYIFDPKLTQTVINKLEKGAGDYLDNSPLKDTFLGSSSRNPEIRRAIAELFRKSTLHGKGGLIIQDVENMCTRMQKESEAGQLINMTDWSLRMALDIVGHMLLQLDLFALEGQQSELIQSLLTILHKCYAMGEITPESPEFRSAEAALERRTTAILDSALGVEDRGADTRLVVRLHEACGFNQARDNMKLFIMAGSETTASTIPVLIYLLTTFPLVQCIHCECNLQIKPDNSERLGLRFYGLLKNRLICTFVEKLLFTILTYNCNYFNRQEELRKEADDNIAAMRKHPALPLPKTEAVLREVLRVYPIAPFISRQTTQDLTIGDITFPANTDIKAFTWGIHRSATQWSKPKDFIPFRFLEPIVRSAQTMYIPFGAGSRICIGQHLAMLELKIACAMMVNRFKFERVKETPELRFVTDWAHAVVHPDKDMLFRLTPR